MRDDIVKDIYIRKSGEIMHLYVISDFHIGSPAFSEEKFKEANKLIVADKLACTLFLGDTIDNDRPTTRLMRKQLFADRPDAQVDEDGQVYNFLDLKVIPMLRPLVKNCVGFMEGDHYREFINGLTSTQYICSQLKTEYLGKGEAHIDLNFKPYGQSVRTISINARHGRSASPSLSGNVRKLENIMMGEENFDIYFRGHSHNPYTVPFARYFRNKHDHRTEQKQGLLMNTCSFRLGKLQKTVDYAEEREYKATSYFLSLVRFRLVINRGEKGQIEKEIKFDGELIYL